MEAFDINIKDEIDFSRLDTDAYYSSAVDDQSSGRIMILDNHFLTSIYRYLILRLLIKLKNVRIMIFILI